jgi:uncharacterized protein YndB with AHSA1/START domain
MATTEIGKLAVRRSIEIDAPPERVWREFESAERMRLWYTSSVVFEPDVGGRLIAEGENQGNHFRFGGQILVYDPPRELTAEFAWDPPEEFPYGPVWPAVTLLTFRLDPVGDGRTRVEIIHHGFEALGDLANEQYGLFEGGWDNSYLNALKAIIEPRDAN